MGNLEDDDFIYAAVKCITPFSVTSSLGETTTTLQQAHRQRSDFPVCYALHVRLSTITLLTIAGFEGASAISSNAYFGRPEDDIPEDDYGDLEGAAKDFVRKFGITAGDDLENLSNLLGEGAGKLQGAIRNYLNS